MKLPVFLRRALTPFLTAFLALAVTVGAVAPYPLISALAATPAFNGHPNDEPTIQVRKNGTTTWGNSVNLNNGETAQFFLYAHNYVPDTVAKNTRLRAVVPAGSSSKHNVQGVLWADNALDQSPQKQVSVNTTNLSELQINYDSVKHYINQDGKYVEQPIANPASLFTAGGLALGDIEGCWQFLRAVTFTATVRERGVSDISTYKEVAVASVDQQWSRDRVSTTPGNVIDFHIYVENTGQSGAKLDTVWVADTLDTNLTYKPGSSWMVTRDAEGRDVRFDFDDKDLLFDGKRVTWRINSVPARPDAAFHLYFQAVLDGPDAFPIGTTTRSNKATVVGVEPAGEITKMTNTVFIDVVKSATPVVVFDIEKDVRNLTTGGQINNDTPIAGRPGDLIQYTLHIVNNGNVSGTALVRDSLHGHVVREGDVLRKFIRETEALYRPVDPAGLFDANGFLTLTNIAPGNLNGVDIRFFVRLNSSIPEDVTRLTNVGRVFNNQKVLHDLDRAYIDLVRTSSYVVKKYVQDPKTGGWSEASTAVVREGARLNYRIDIVNAGDTSLLINSVKDILPQYTTYIDNSLVMDPHISPTPIVNDDDFFNAGLVNFQLLPGITKRFEFSVIVAKCPILGKSTLVNAVYVTANNKPEATIATATIQLQVDKPNGGAL